MRPIFEYQDYRRFLRAWRDDKPKARSQRSLAKKLDISDGFVSMVFSGQRPLSLDDAPAWARAMRLEGDEASHFVAMVRAAHGTAADRASAELELRARRNFGRAQPTSVDPVFAAWHPWAILELARCDGFQDDPDWLASKLVPNVPADEVAAALAALQDAGLLELRDGRLRPSDRPVAFPTESVGEGMARIKALHRLHLTHAAEALELPPEDRHVVSIVFAASRSALPDLARRLDQVVREAVEAALAFDDPDQVLQVSLQILPRSERLAP